MRRTGPDSLELPAAIRQALTAHAGGEPAREVCGLLGGNGKRAQHYYPVSNIAADPRRRFMMEPRQQIAAMRQMRESGESLLGIFHSHPGSAARPSATDLAMAAYADTIYLIAGLTNKEVELKAWYYDGTGFTQIKTRLMDT